ncbi:hypothetical protein CFI10_01755 [Marinobacterium iners]|uniref:hypothetical protein n=1 Tax=Marinobacterium iners TaxID=48076 RepID=UPI001A8F84EC|nr:hypothetical protein [Marinobacterium iners]QSR33722.1 hypothetical protein CFI10_01755 [Marinobacterium iners]
MSRIAIILVAILSFKSAYAELNDTEIKEIKSKIFHKLTFSWRIPSVKYERDLTTSLVSFNKEGEILEVSIVEPAKNDNEEIYHNSIFRCFERAKVFEFFKDYKIEDEDIEKHFTKMEVKFWTPPMR